MTDDKSIDTLIREIAVDVAVLKSVSEAHIKTTEDILAEARNTNGRLRTAEADIVYMKPIVQEYCALRSKVVMGLLSLLAIGWAGGAGAVDIVVQVLAEIVK